MPPPPAVLLFDWDNTLVDAWAGIVAALNDVFAQWNLPPWTVEQGRQRIRGSMRDSFPPLFGDTWEQAVAAFAPATLELLADRGVRLVGIDTASVDPAASKTLEAHQVLLRRDLRVLENLVLDDVPEGDYELIALPLRLVQADASPVRAVLREL